MICPGCGVDNLAGKLLCYKCGTKLLQAPERASQRGGKAERKKKKFRGIYFLFPLIFLGIVFYFILQKLDIEPLETSLQAARSLETKLEGMGKAVLAKRSVKVEVTQEELNSLVAEGLGEIIYDEEYARRNVKLDDIQMRFEGEKLKSVVTMKVKGKPIYVSLSGKVDLMDSKLTLNPDEIKIGKLPVPAKIVLQAMRRVKKERGNFSFLDLPPGVRAVRIEGGKLVIEAGPEASTTALIEGETEPVPQEELKPAPKKKILTAEEREEIRKKRIENEANSWLQVGDNFTSVKMYGLALEYYRKVINKYPESEQAQKARERIKKVKAKLESIK